ncbi:MAG: DegT/DnrJ/EryC1/StrS family aminotransferase [Bacteroidales bacterium]|jgi:dTDP-4-amino-4,6-dideoxygalactose transaminase
MPINVFVPKFHTEEILNEIRECLNKGWTGMGFKTIEFENKWKEYTGLQSAHFLNSNTSGLHLAVHQLKMQNNWNEGDEIITSPITFVSSNHVILYERLKPIFADVDQYLCLDPDDIERKITPRTRAVMYVGMGGNTGQYGRIIEICKKHNLKLILDAAHMAGTKFRGNHVGHEADVSIFSYQAVKNLPTADSGMICFNNEESDKLVRQLSWLGISKDTYQRFNKTEGSYKWQYDVPNIGFKYHGNSIVASIALVQLKYLDEDNIYRNQLAHNYIELLQKNTNVKIVPVAPDCVSSRHLFQVLVPNRDEVIQIMYDNKIYPGVHYLDNTDYPMYNYAKGTCPNATYYSEHLLSLPLHLNITETDQQQIVEVLLKAIK